MCGIAAVKGDDAVNRVLNILIAQEHRGNVATGIAYIDNNTINIIKKAVKPSDFIKLVNIDSNITTCIGHNRAPSSNIQHSHLDTEAHPFMSEDGSFALVHNGTFRSADHISYLLKLLGHSFSSGVDSEAYVHLLETILNKHSDIHSAISALQPFICGTLLILFRDSTIIGIGPTVVIHELNGCYQVASESSSLNIKEGKLYFPESLNAYFILNDSGLSLYSKWDSFTIKDGFIPVTKSTCDFCNRYGFCEPYYYYGSIRLNRCYNCYSKNITKPKHTHEAIILPRYFDDEDDYSCAICGSTKSLIECPLCYRLFCYNHYIQHSCYPEW